MSETLLETKLHIPGIRAGYVSRPRLLAILQDGMQRKLTMLSAPAGFGKSTLLAGWIQQDKIPAGWLSLDEGENDLSRFLAYLVAAINTIDANVGHGISDLLKATRLGSPTPILNILINELADIQGDFALVLDDYHLIQSDQVQEALKYLIEHQPATLHIYLATRADPPLPLALLRGRGEMVELRASELRFTKEEASEFIHRTTGILLSEMDADTLTQLTEGWITGIQMASISMKDRSDAAAFLRDFSGSHRYVLDYLVEEVLEIQPDRIKAFLYRTSILERMNGPLCDELLAYQNLDLDAPDFDPGDGQRFLVDLEHQNLFIQPLDEQRQWYRYHHLFADLLRLRLKTRHPELISHLHKRAAAWYLEENLYPDAIHHSLACDDHEAAVKMIAAVAEEAMMRSDFTLLKGWIEALPNDILTNYPRLHCYHLFTALLSGISTIEVAQLFDQIQGLDQKQEIQGDILALQALLAVYEQNLRRSAKLAEQALAVLPENRHFFRSTIAGFLGFAYFIDGDTEAARRTLEESARVSAKVGNLTMEVLALCHLSEIATLEGDLPQAESNYRRVLEMGADPERKPQPILGLAQIGLGMVQREKGQLDEALENLRRGVELFKKWTPSGAIQGYVYMAWIHQFQGDEAAADAFIEAAAKLARQFEPLEEDDKYVRYHQAKLEITRGNPKQALKLFSISPEISIEELDQIMPAVDFEGSKSFSELIYNVAIGEAFLALGKYDIAENLVSRSWEISRTRKWRRIDMAILTTLAEIHWRCGRRKQARQFLARSLEIATRGGYVIDYFERGARITGLLQDGLHAGIQPEFVGQLLTQIETLDTGYSPSSPSEKANLLLIEPLSERELEILALIEKGLTNPEIASQLVIATTTVKKHVSNILGKLGVPNREEAVTRGRELGLI